MPGRLFLLATPITYYEFFSCFMPIEIRNGDVTISQNSHICFLDKSVNWTDILYDETVQKVLLQPNMNSSCM